MVSNLLFLLLELQILLALGVAAVLLSRKAVRQRFGASAAYRLWMLVPVLMLTAFVPARTILKVVPTVSAPSTLTAPPATSPMAEPEAATPVAVPTPEAVQAPATVTVMEEAPALEPTTEQSTLATDASSWPTETHNSAVSRTYLSIPTLHPYDVLMLWGLGAIGFAALLYFRQRAYEASLGQTTPFKDNGIEIHRSSRSDIGPALIGLHRPRIVIPDDFDETYTAAERQLIIAHETVHLRRGDAQANGIAAALLCFGWFNPLLHIALKRFRLDQELACDAEVIRQHPTQRRAYGEAMLKCQLKGADAPLACYWLPNHPLKERIAMLTVPTPTGAQRFFGTVIVTSVIAGAGTLAWASQPETILVSDTVETAPQKTNETLDFPPIFESESTSEVKVVDVRGLKFENTIGILKVIPENRSDYAIQIDGETSPSMRQQRGSLVIDGGLPKRNRHCRSITAQNVMDRDKAVMITVRVPLDADIDADGILFTDVGITNDATLNFSGCGAARIANTAGPLELNAHGVVNVTFGDVADDLDLSVHGASVTKGGHVNGDLDMSVHGAGKLTLGNIGGMADMSVHGSGNVSMGHINGPLDGSVHGSGKVIAKDVEGQADLSIHGAGNMKLAALEGALDASLHGAGHLSIDNTTSNVVDVSASGAASIDLGNGQIQKMAVDVNSAGRIHFDGKANFVDVENSSAGSIYIEHVGKVVLEDSNPKGRVKLRTADTDYR